MEAYRVRDKRTKDRFFVDNLLIRGWGPIIGAYGIAVYNVLCMHADIEDQDCWPSHATIAQLTAISVSTVKRAIEQLVECGLVAKAQRERPDGGRSSNEYILLRVPDPPGHTELPPRSQGPTPQVTQSYEQSPEEQSSREQSYIKPDAASRPSSLGEDPSPLADGSTGGEEEEPAYLALARRAVEKPGSVEVTFGGPLEEDEAHATRVDWTWEDVQLLEMVDWSDQVGYCGECNYPIQIRGLSNTRATCPGCTRPVQVNDPEGKSIKLPAQKYREGHRPRKQALTLGSLFDRCPDPLKGESVPKELLASIQTELGRDPWTLFEAVIWSKSKSHTGVLKRALAALPTFRKGKAQPAREEPPREQQGSVYSAEWLALEAQESEGADG